MLEIFFSSVFKVDEERTGTHTKKKKAKILYSFTGL
jgi:hypothetical protein